MGGSSSNQDSSQLQTDSSVSSEQHSDNSQSFGLQDVDGSNIAGGDQTVYSVDSVVTGQAADNVSRALESVDTATVKSLDFGSGALSKAFEFGTKALNSVASSAKDSQESVSAAYDKANKSETGQTNDQFQTTVRWLGVGSMVALSIYLYRKGAA